MKVFSNENGSISWLFLFVIFIVLFGILSVDKDRVVIADGINSGTLVPNILSRGFISDGDEVLRGIKERYRENLLYIPQDYWAAIFYAKVCYERARLEMEMAAQKAR